MGTSYTQLILEERCTIARLQETGYSIRHIAATYARSASTVSREIKRNTVKRIADCCNNTPRKCLDFQTPAEVFSKQLLHFKCESTFRPAPV